MRTVELRGETRKSIQQSKERHNQKKWRVPHTEIDVLSPKTAFKTRNERASLEQNYQNGTDLNYILMLRIEEEQDNEV